LGMLTRSQYDSEHQRATITLEIGNLGWVGPASRNMLEHYLESANLNVNLKYTLPETNLTTPPSSTIKLKRCDIPLWSPVPRFNSTVLSYFDTCRRENTFIKFRNYLALLTASTWGKEALIPHDLNKTKHVLIVLRACTEKPIPDSRGYIHPHHLICFDHHSDKYQRIVKGFENKGFTTFSTYLTNTTMAQQALLFSNASILILPHGAAYTNCLYVRSGTVIIEVTPYMKNPNVEVLVRGRGTLQGLSRNFWSRGVLTKYKAITSAPPSLHNTSVFYGRGCEDWSCYDADKFVQVVMAQFYQLRADFKALQSDI
jgi:hypothetical protein